MPEAIRPVDPRITVVMCGYNEAANVPLVLPRLPHDLHEILFIDGNSTDGTVEAVRAVRPDVRVLLQPTRGKGEAVRFGIGQATGDVVVMLDADGETDPAELQDFVEPLRRGYDWAKGSRFTEGWQGKPFRRIFGNLVIVWTFNVLNRTRYTDLCSGYNAFWRDVMTPSYMWADDGWNFEPFFMARLHRVGARVVEVAQHESARSHGESKLPDWKQGLTAVWKVITGRFWRPPTRR